MSKTVLILWCVLSFFVSGLFIFYGLMLLQLKELSSIDFFSAIVSLIYGITSIYLLAQAWVNPDEKYVTISKYVVLIMFFIQLILNIGITGGLELTTMTVVVVMLVTNWVSVKHVADSKK